MRDDGGPAFPMQEQIQPATDGGNAWLSPGQPGMSLRDWFAGKAMEGMLASQKCEAFDGVNTIAISDAAFRYADAMLAARAAARERT